MAFAFGWSSSFWALKHRTLLGRALLNTILPASKRQGSVAQSFYICFHASEVAQYNHLESWKPHFTKSNARTMHHRNPYLTYEEPT